MVCFLLLCMFLFDKEDRNYQSELQLNLQLMKYSIMLCCCDMNKLIGKLIVEMKSNNNDTSGVLFDDCFRDCVKFCSKCGVRNDLVFDTGTDDLNTIVLIAKTSSNVKINHKNGSNDILSSNEERDNEICINLLKYMCAIESNKKFLQDESRQSKWVFENECGRINMNVSFVNLNEVDKSEAPELSNDTQLIENQKKIFICY